VGKYFENQLRERIGPLPLVGDVRGSHFMMCVENVADKTSKELLPAEVRIGDRIADKCQERRVIVRPLAHKNVLSPPLILTREQVDTIVDALHESITEVQDDLSREGVWS